MIPPSAQITPTRRRNIDNMHAAAKKIVPAIAR
jgi:hypothetical protein